ncbi:MAG: LysM peptidoglycan-binding domain-containing protein [Dictyoglomus sp.]
MKRFLRELLIYSISFLLIVFLTSQLFSLERRPYVENLIKIESNESLTLRVTYTHEISQNQTTTTFYVKEAEEKKSEELRQPDKIIYEVKVGDTMIGIAQRYGVDWREIAKVNNLKDPNYLVVGQKLVIPLKSK